MHSYEHDVATLLVNDITQLLRQLLLSLSTPVSQSYALYLFSSCYHYL